MHSAFNFFLLPPSKPEQPGLRRRDDFRCLIQIHRAALHLYRANVFF